MDGTGPDQHGVRQRQLRYEDRTEQIRQRIDGLINAYADLETALEDQRPTITDDHLRLDQLDASVRNCITQLLPLITAYDQAVDEWDRWDAEFYVLTEDTPWTRKVHRTRTMFFRHQSRDPPLSQRVQQLIQEYNHNVIAISTCRDALQAREQAQAALQAARSPRTPSTVQSPATSAVSEATHSVANETLEVRSSTSGSPSEAAHSAADETQRRTDRIAETSHSEDDALTPVSTNRTVASPVATGRSRLSMFSPMHVWNMASQFASSLRFGRPTTEPAVAPPNQGSAPASSARPASTPRSSNPDARGRQPVTTTRRPTPRRTTPPTQMLAPRTTAPTRPPRRPFAGAALRPPPVQQLDFGDNSTLSPASAHGHDDFGDFRHDRQSTWYPDDDDLPPMGLMGYVDGDVRQPPRHVHWDNGPGANRFYADFNAPSPAAAPHPSAATTGPTPHSGYGTGPANMPFSYAPSPPVSRNAPAYTRTAAPDFSVAGRGPTPTPPLSTPPVSDQPASNAPTVGSTDRESTSSFYRAANRRFTTAPSSTAPPPLLLKELPIEPFDGDMRKFPTFRLRFLDTMHSHKGLEPRHRVQFLLQCLKGTPRNLVEPFELLDENYWTAIDLLEERYGDKCLIRKLFRTDLLALPISSIRTTDLQRLHDATFHAMQTLKLIGCDPEPDEFYGDLILGKLPDDVKTYVIRHPRYTSAKPLSIILEALRGFLNERAQIESAGYNNVLRQRREEPRPAPTRRSATDHLRTKP